MTYEPTYQRSMPPWIWFYIVISFFYLPYYAYIFSTNLNSINNEMANPTQGLIGPIKDTLHLIVITWMTLGELLPLVAVLLGGLTLFFPQMRARYISKKYNLQNKEAYDTKSMSEISDYIGHIAPDILIKANLARTDQIAFIYPLGFHKTALAVFGGLIRLWNSDRDAAEAVLLHEIGHYRQGDTFILGTGSFFGYIIDNWFKITLLFIFVPLILQQTIFGGFDTLSDYKTILPILLTIPIYIFETLIFFILPIMAIWCSEIGADRYMATHGKSVETSLEIIDRLSENLSIFKNLLISPSHPPKKIRKYFIKRTHSMSGFTLSTLLFPLGFLVRFIFIEILAISTYFGHYFNNLWGLDTVISRSVVNFQIYFGETMPVTWICLILMILVWPFIKDKWYSLFSNTIEIQRHVDIKGYAIVSFVVMVIFILTYFVAMSIQTTGGELYYV